MTGRRSLARSNAHLLVWRRAIVVTSTVLLAACSVEWPHWCDPAAPRNDWDIESLGLAAPQPAAIDMSLLDMATVGAHYEGPPRFIAAVLRGDYPVARQFLAELESIADPTERMRQVYRLKFALGGRNGYLLDASRAWVKAEPQEPTARLLLGMSMSEMALQARGSGFSREVEPSQMALFQRRFELARVPLEAVARQGGVLSWLAHDTLQAPYFFAGESDKGWSSIEYLIGAAPQYGWLYFWATTYALPQWAGDAAETRLRRLEALADMHRLNEADRKVLGYEVEYRRKALDKSPNPQAWRPYWQRRQAQAPHLYNLLQWLGQEHYVNNWQAVDTIATQAIAINPHQAYALHLRGLARTELGNHPGALRDTLAAAVLGNDDAMSRLVAAHVSGGMGVRTGDMPLLLAHCRLGAALGLPSGANCMGSSLAQGLGGVPMDKAQAVAWHLMAARGGLANSQHDLAVLLPQALRGEGDDVQEVAQHWMRQAARQGHVYAKRKLPHDEPPAELLPVACRVVQFGLGLLLP